MVRLSGPPPRPPLEPHRANQLPPRSVGNERLVVSVGVAAVLTRRDFKGFQRLV